MLLSLSISITMACSSRLLARSFCSDALTAIDRTCIGGCYFIIFLALRLTGIRISAISRSDEGIKFYAAELFYESQAARGNPFALSL